MIQIDIEMPKRCADCPCFNDSLYGKCQVKDVWLGAEDGAGFLISGRIGARLRKPLLVRIRKGMNSKMENRKTSIEFTDEEWDRILDYMEVSGSVTVQVAVMNAISIAMDDIDFKE